MEKTHSATSARVLLRLSFLFGNELGSEVMQSGSKGRLAGPHCPTLNLASSDLYLSFCRIRYRSEAFVIVGM